MAPTALIESRVDWVCGVLSLRHFRLARRCSLSLGGWWAEESGAAHFGFGGAMLLDLLGPPGLAGGAVADFVA
jgi:hypothetical protein